MTKKNFHGYLQADTVRYKKHLHVLRPLLAVKRIDAERGTPPGGPRATLPHWTLIYAT